MDAVSGMHGWNGYSCHVEKDVFMFWISSIGSGAVITSGMSIVCCILAPPAEELTSILQ